MNITYQRFGVWSGIAFFFLFFLALWPMAGFIPPPDPALTGEGLLDLYKGNLLGVRAAMIVGLLATMLLVPWSATISIQMARIEGRYPMMAMVAFGAGVANVVAFYLPFVFWSAAYYRVDRAPELVQMLSDLTWLEFVMVYAPFAMQTLAIAVVGIFDKSASPTFPRWFCFLSIWVSVAIIPGGFAIFFRASGPFAWDGLIAFWMPVCMFTIYFASLVPLMFKAISRQEAEELRLATIA